MAIIAYSIAGDGGGHASRNYVIISRLAKRGHFIDVFTSHRTYDELKARFSHTKHVQVFRIPGLRFGFKKNRVSLLQTIAWNAGTILGYPFTKIKLIKLFKKRKYDLLITDFDFFFAKANNSIAIKQQIPRVQINHFAMFKCGKFKASSRTKVRALILKVLLRTFYPDADITLINSFYKLGNLSEHKMKFIGPVLRDEVLRKKAADKGYVLVYLKPSIEQAVYPAILALAQTGTKFVVYSPHPEKLESASHVILKKFSSSLIDDLAKASCVITNAGIELPSEAAYLSKPIFAVEETGQVEQEINGYFISKLGLGVSVPSISLKKEQLAKFLSNLETHKERVRRFRKTMSIGTDKAIAEIESILENAKAGK